MILDKRSTSINADSSNADVVSSAQTTPEQTLRLSIQTYKEMLQALHKEKDDGIWNPLSQTSIQCVNAYFVCVQYAKQHNLEQKLIEEKVTRSSEEDKNDGTNKMSYTLT